MSQLFVTRGWHHIPAAGQHEGVLGPPHPQQWPPYTGHVGKGMPECTSWPNDSFDSEQSSQNSGNKGHLNTDNSVIYTPGYLIQICQRLGSFYVYQLVASFCVGLVLGEFAHGIRFRALIWEAKRAPWPHVLIKIPAANTSCKYLLQIPFVCVFPTLTQLRLDSY